ncbi:DUF389 domain-containing protein [Comamonas suwonensis]|uniref:DUF389 domain-containing protein n=1 Tax=Comamonas suwonensis TaxID=2606214 RepID=A0A843B3K1_9BURK|nr:DUF389 domain-containing protein [Comamonas suwonensis]MBI1625341.1 DUF389 domain-containing protein [Comamonas suwonensis]
MRPNLLFLFDLRKDQQEPSVIDETVRSGAQFGGTNLWVLFFAILIASVGLNTNSTAVIIGAMLISPLMGPIVGMGYGAAVQDLGLIRMAGKNLAIFVVLSLLTSVLYFTLSPLEQPQSELMARTFPTLWDVLIAAFGGAAGMVAVTRRGYSNVVPGVAIATALMPPLCTAGFGIAHGRWDMFGGAFYLFIINSMFIGASTLAVAKLLRLPRQGELDEVTRKRHRLIIALGLTVVLVPSVWMGYRLVQQEVFASAAVRVARDLEAEPNSHVLMHEVDAGARTLRLIVVGRTDEAQLREQVQRRMLRDGQADVTVLVRDAGDDSLNVEKLRSELEEGVNKTLVEQVKSMDAQLKALQQDVAEAKALDEKPPVKAVDALALLQEVQAQQPLVCALTLAQGERSDNASNAAQPSTVVVLDVANNLNTHDRDSLSRWLGVRLEKTEVQLIERLDSRSLNARDKNRRKQTTCSPKS